MKSKVILPGASDQRRQQLTIEVKKHAKAARAETLHRERVSHAVACGKALAKLKEALGHGGWNRWVKEKCALSRMTANRYIRLASRAKELSPDMTIREAYIAAGVIVPKQTGRKVL